MGSLREYHYSTKSLTYSFFSVLPLLILYEVLLMLSEPASYEQVRLTADLWIKTVFAWTGTNTLLLTTLLIVVSGFIIYIKEHKTRPPLRFGHFPLMILESLLWAIVISGLLVTLIGRFLAMTSPADGAEISFTQWLALAIGAGVYEELVFRVILVGSLLFVFRQLFTSEWPPILFSVVIGAIIFSGVHYIGAFGDVFTWPSFMFRFLFGLALTALLICRGFGIAAWTHSLYDVLVISFGRM